jgi:hypothetical protein
MKKLIGAVIAAGAAATALQAGTIERGQPPLRLSRARGVHLDLIPNGNRSALQLHLRPVTRHRDAIPQRHRIRHHDRRETQRANYLRVQLPGFVMTARITTMNQRIRP